MIQNKYGLFSETAWDGFKEAWKLFRWLSADERNQYGSLMVFKISSSKDLN